MYLVRHGETELNKLNQIQGWVDSPLTEDGLEIAHLCGLGLKDIEFDVAYSSDLMRAVKTTEIILIQNNLNAIPHSIKKGLREISYGSFGGSDKNSYKTACSKVLFKEENLNLLNEKIHSQDTTVKELIDAGCSLDTSGQAENYAHFEERVLKEIKQIFVTAKRKDQEKVLVVSHGLVIFTLLNNFSSESIQYISEVKNASVSLLKFVEDSIAVDEAASMKYVRAGEKLQSLKY